jgi:hypothetical protein
MSWYPGKIFKQLKSDRGMQVNANVLKFLFEGIEELVKNLEDSYKSLNRFIIGMIDVFSVLDGFSSYHGEKQMYTMQQLLRYAKRRFYDTLLGYDDHSPGLFDAIDYILDYVNELDDINSMLNKPIDPSRIESIIERLDNLKKEYRNIRYNYETILGDFYSKYVLPF